MHGITGDEVLAKRLIESLNKTLDVYDTILANQKFVAGDVSIHQSYLTCSDYS